MGLDDDAVLGETMNFDVRSLRAAKRKIRQMTQRDALLVQMTAFFRAIPHEKHCPRQPPLEGNVQCSCRTGDRLGPIVNKLGTIIRENTELDASGGG
jgi:hypothetical protein